MARRAAIILLLAAHVAAHFAQLAMPSLQHWIERRGWFDPWTAREALESVVWSVFLAQAGLIAGWFTFSSRPRMGRLFGAAILLGLLGAGVFHVLWEQSGASTGILEIASFGVTLTMSSFITATLLLQPARRYDRLRLRWDSANPAQQRRPAQFRLREMMAWTFGAALVLGATRLVIPKDAGLRGLPVGWDIYLLLGLTGVFFGLHAVLAIWACSAPRRLLLPALIFAGLVLLGLALAENAGFVWMRLIVSEYESKMHLIGAATEFAVFGGTLLVLRACGLQLEKQALTRS